MSLPFTPEQEAALAAYCRVATTEARWRELPSAWRATGLTDEDFKPMLFIRLATTLLDRLAAAERDIATLLEIASEIDPRELGSEDAETLNRIRQRTQEKRT